MSESLIIDLLTNVGFPIAMVFWFMLRTEKIIERNNVVVAQLKDVVEELVHAFRKV